MGIKTVCTMSGLPAGSAGDLMPNWVVSSWPPATQEILRYQLEEKLLPFWEEIVALAKECGVERIALELHGNQYVYNVPSLLLGFKRAAVAVARKLAVIMHCMLKTGEVFDPLAGDPA